jgi:hypothetical protein
MMPNRNDSTAAAGRMRALLTRWQQSLELHARYLTLDDTHYWHVQPWPPHERPAAWIIQLARQKVAELTRALEEHVARDDPAFAAGIEQMLFLANLVGLQQAGRYIPLADAQNERLEILAPAEPLSVAPAPPPASLASPPEDSAPGGGSETTREMPRTRTNRALRAPRATRALPADAQREPVPAPARLDPATQQIYDDAVRLLQWGRKWHELGELISRLGNRPSVGEVRRMLREHRARIEAASRVPPPT